MTLGSTMHHNLLDLGSLMSCMHSPKELTWAILTPKSFLMNLPQATCCPWSSSNIPPEVPCCFSHSPLPALRWHNLSSSLLPWNSVFRLCFVIYNSCSSLQKWHLQTLILSFKLLCSKLGPKGFHVGEETRVKSGEICECLQCRLCSLLWGNLTSQCQALSDVNTMKGSVSLFEVFKKKRERD